MDFGFLDSLHPIDSEVKQRGDTFLLATYVRDHLSSENRIDDWEAMEKLFIHESRSLNYLLPGANELFEWLDADDKSYGILTYGDVLWQKLKLSAAGFKQIPHIIMDKKEKGKLISSWLDAHGVFQIPSELGGGSADGVVMFDDKAVSFSQFPPSPSRGFWVLDSGHELLSQRGVAPGNVERLSDLSEALRRLDDIDKA